MGEQPERKRLSTNKLDSLANVRAEMAKIYRQVRAGRLDAGDATKLTYILKEIRACIEAARLVEVAAMPASPRKFVYEIVNVTEPREGLERESAAASANGKTTH